MNKFDYLKLKPEDESIIDDNVEIFINNFYNSANAFGINNESLRQFFRRKYCYYFAVILNSAFGRGDIVICYPYGHVAWRDTNGIVYDIEGFCESEYEKLITPDESLGHIDDFKHLPGYTNFITQEELDKLGK